LFDPAEQELLNTRRQLDQLNGKILETQFNRFTTNSDKAVTLFTAFHAIFITDVNMATCIA
jgi:hypothetical protein